MNGSSHRRGIGRKSTRGIALVELALAMPLLILLISGVAMFGGMYYLESEMADAARDAARRLATGEITAAQASASVSNALSDWNHTFTITVTEADPGNPAERDCTVTVSVPRNQAAQMDILGLFTSGNLTVTVTMRQEYET